MSIRKQILLAEDRPRHAIALPEWGVGTLYVNTLSAADRDDYERWAFGDDRSNYRAKLVCRALVEENGARVFEDDDATAVGHKSAAVVARIFDLACHVNGLLKSDVEDLEKNSARAGSDDSGSGSPSPGDTPTPTGC